MTVTAIALCSCRALIMLLNIRCRLLREQQDCEPHRRQQQNHALLTSTRGLTAALERQQIRLLGDPRITSEL